MVGYNNELLVHIMNIMMIAWNKLIVCGTMIQCINTRNGTFKSFLKSWIITLCIFVGRFNLVYWIDCYCTNIIDLTIVITRLPRGVYCDNIHRNDATNDDENVKKLLTTTFRQHIFNTSPVSFNRRLTPRSWIFNGIFCIVIRDVMAMMGRRTWIGDTKFHLYMMLM